MIRLICVLLLSALSRSAPNEEYPWKYDNDAFGGPDYWGLVDRRWEMCARGKLQSPIDIQPDRLLHDPGLRPIHLDRISVMSEMVNTGQMPRVRIGNSARRPSANVTGGPLHGYRYRVQRVDIHFGRGDRLNGSEHSIDGRKFPMELQLLAYNTDLYGNFSTAMHSPHGLAAISVLVELGPETNEELLKLTVATASVINKNERVELADLRPWHLLPYTRDYVTYDGSLTSPGCHETITWIIINQPIHITKDHLSSWGSMLQTEAGDTSTSEPRFLAPNSRAPQEFHGRLLRTNIQHKSKGSAECASTRLTYRSNTHIPQPPSSSSSHSPNPLRGTLPEPKKHHKRRHHTAHPDTL